MNSEIRTATVTLFFSGLAGAVGAAGLTDTGGFQFDLLGQCAVLYYVDTANEFAMVQVWREDLMEGRFPGGAVWSGEITYDSFPEITTAWLEGCLGLSPATIVAFSQTGADAPTFSEEDYIGFTFTTTQDSPLGGFPAGTYSYGVGAAPSDADGMVSEALSHNASIGLNTTADTLDEAVDVIAFTLSDGGTADATPLSVTGLQMNVSGTGASVFSKLTWILNGPDATDVQGEVNDGKVTFSGLSIEVTDGGSETYTVSAYFIDNTGLTEGQAIVLSIDADTDITVASGSTTFGATSPVTNGSGAAITVEATQLAFTTQPSGSTSGSALSTQPVVVAQDAFGNTDTDFTGTVTLAETAEGMLSGTTSMAAEDGVATFSGLTYTATADQEVFTLTASSGTLTVASANSVTSDVVATALTFATEPAPASFPGNEAVTFTTVPVVQAVDANSVVDTGFTGTVALSEVEGAGSATFSNNSVSASAGVATFTGLGMTYTNSGVLTETFRLRAASGSLTSADSTQLTARLAPSVTGVTATTADGSYKAGEAVTIQVAFSDEVTVAGSPQLTLETGATDRIATYVSGSGSATLTFAYTVQAGDTSADLDYATTSALSANGGTIRSKVDTDVDAVLTLAMPGETGSLGAAKALVIDTTTPTGYAVSLDQTVINNTGQSSASFTFSGAEVGTDYSYSVSSSGGGTAVTGSGTIATATDQITGLDLSGLGDGTLTLSVTLTDDAGNAGNAATDTVVKDATLPTGHSVAFDQTVISDANASAAGFTFSGAEVGTDYSYAISSSGGGTNVTGTGTVAGASEQVANLDLSGLADGTLTLTVTLTDEAGNAASAVTDTVTKDATAPAAPSAATLDLASNSGDTTDALTNDTTATISGTAEANASVTVSVGATTVGTTTADGAGSWSFTFDTGDLASGANTITTTATDAAGNVSPASAAFVITLDADAPTVALSGPTGVVTSDFTVTITFSEIVSGVTVDDVTVTNGTKGTFAETVTGTTYTLGISPDLGSTVSISVVANAARDAAGNPNSVSDTFQVQAGSPASAFDERSDDIRRVIADEARRSLNATLAANRRMTDQARGRLLEARRSGDGGDAGLVSNGDVPFDVDGVFQIRGPTVSTRGDFFARQGSRDGGYDRLVFGDFDLQHDGTTGSTTATVAARVAWERMMSDSTLLGYFVGGELAFSDIEGAFTGEQDRIGATIGIYAVHALDEHLFLDGFATLGAGRNDLYMGDDVLDLGSTYTTRSITLGAALSGAYAHDRYEFRPELSLSYGQTWIGDVGFTGRAYGLVDESLSLDAGTVSTATLTLRPEVVWALDADTVAASTARLRFAPRLVCEDTAADTRTHQCGGGAEIGVSSRSRDGLSRAELRLVMDRVGDSRRSSLLLGLEHQF